MPPRKMTDIPPAVVAELNRGERETSVLVEGFTIDFSELMRCALPRISDGAVERMRAGLGEPYTKRLRLAASICLDEFGDDVFDTLRAHPSDTVRGWASYAAGLIEGLSLPERFSMVRPLADDPHFGVREWAWLGVRAPIVDDPEEAVRVLTPWASDPGANIRRYSSEATRPRGVWAAHIRELRERPEIALPLLEPLRSDPSKYVQDSVANWLNDASKSRPDWVRDLCERWATESGTPETIRICTRAMRSI